MINSMLYRYIIIGLVLIVASCDFVQVKNEPNNNTNAPKPIARVHDNYLYASEIAGIVSANNSPEDSANLMNAYMNNWIRKQLLIDEASAKIDFDEAEIQRKILDYRYSLIAYEYKSYYINQHLNTEVTDAEVEEYYQNNLDNFPLKQNIIRGRFIRLPKENPPSINIKSMIASSRPEKLEELRSFCFSNALMYSLEDSVWINFDDIIKNTPLAQVPNKVDFLSKTKYTESSDDNSKYYLLIKEYKKTDDIAPIEVVKDQIVDIIINKRKVELARNLEKEVYEKAIQTNAFEVY